MLAPTRRGGRPKGRPARGVCAAASVGGVPGCMIRDLHLVVLICAIPEFGVVPCVVCVCVCVLWILDMWGVPGACEAGRHADVDACTVRARRCTRTVSYRRHGVLQIKTYINQLYGLRFTLRSRQIDSIRIPHSPLDSGRGPCRVQAAAARFVVCSLFPLSHRFYTGRYTGLSRYLRVAHDHSRPPPLSYAGHWKWILCDPLR